VLVDVLGSVISLTSLPADLSRTISTLAPGIIIWDQYVDLVEWVLGGLGNFFNSGGLAIIAFTIIVKTLLLPLTVKSIRSSKAMQELAPKIKEIQKKYGQDRQRASQETMALYSQHGVNPMAGCLPMLIQIPIFFGVYTGIRALSGSDAEAWRNGFLWLDSLKQADPWHILPILAGLFQFVQTRMMRPANQKVTDPQQQIMNTMMTFMPLTVVLFGWGFDSGPVLYWVVQALYSVVQQWLITGWGSIGEWLPWLPELPEHRRLGYTAPRDINDVIVVSGAAPERKGFQGWLHKRMEEAQQNAAQRQEEMKKRGSAPATTATTETTDGEATPAKPTKRASYQSRVDAATKFGSRNGQAPAATDAATAPSTSSAPAGNRPRSKKKKRAS
jgi:YidC/Oxa1 family membrane protein insertase